MYKNIEKQTKLNLKELVKYQEGQVVSKTLVQNDYVSMTIFSFDKGEEISTHAAGGDAMVTVLEGKGRFTVGGEVFYVEEGETLIMPKDIPHITMLVMMESIQNRIVENGQKGKATWLYIDEFHVLLNSEYSAKYLQQLWKKVRKQGGLCTGITQNVVDLLQNYTATTMLANSEFVALLKQANTDSSKMAEVIGVSEAQLRFVTNTASGMGLIKCGSVVIPFDNQISKDTDLYRLYNTNIHEKIAEQKKKEAKFAD